MKYNTIISIISKQLADELVSEAEMLSYMDRVIDDINARLDTVFPTFTEFKEANGNIDGTILDYTAIPDKYIRTVVVPGAASKYYTTDEEGGYAAPKYADDYAQGLFYMERDFSFSVPEQYRAENQGFVEWDLDSDGGLIASVDRGGIF